jgi:hypothetical protein
MSAGGFDYAVSSSSSSRREKFTIYDAVINQLREIHRYIKNPPTQATMGFTELHGVLYRCDRGVWKRCAIAFETGDRNICCVVQIKPVMDCILRTARSLLGSPVILECMEICVLLLREHGEVYNPHGVCECSEERQIIRVNHMLGIVIDGLDREYSIYKKYYKTHDLPPSLS